MDLQLDQTAPITNREVALQRLGGDAKLFATLAGFFLQDAPALLQQLHDAHHRGAVELVFQSAHSLKGLSATFEAVPFLRAVGEIESLTRTGDSSGLDRLISNLDYEFDRLVANLQDSAA